MIAPTALQQTPKLALSTRQQFVDECTIEVLSVQRQLANSANQACQFILIAAEHLSPSFLPGPPVGSGSKAKSA